MSFPLSLVFDILHLVGGRVGRIRALSCESRIISILESVFKYLESYKIRVLNITVIPAPPRAIAQGKTTGSEPFPHCHLLRCACTVRLSQWHPATRMVAQPWRLRHETAHPAHFPASRRGPRHAGSTPARQARSAAADAQAAQETGLRAEIAGDRQAAFLRLGIPASTTDLHA